MAGLIREDDIAQVRERADIVEIVRQYVTLKPAGGGAFKGLCPFHDEKSPSFHVRPGKGFHCFGCSEGGDVISDFDGAAVAQAGIAAGFAFVAALVALTLMMRLLKAVSFTPYVVYRLILGVALLVYAYS